MANLLLDSLEVKGFRGFSDLNLRRLGRVNLIVGKNNTGKTSLLEALRLFADRAAPNLIWELLGTRAESNVSLIREAANYEERTLSALRFLFYGRPEIKRKPKPIQIGSMRKSSDRLTLTVEWYSAQAAESGGQQLRLLPDEELEKEENTVLRLVVTINGRHRMSFPLDLADFRRRYTGFPRNELEPIMNVFIPANGLSDLERSRMWDTVVITEQDETLVRSLRIMSPQVERVNMIGGRLPEYPSAVRPRYDEQPSTSPIPVVKVAGVDNLIPLRNLGEGMSRMFGLALALVNAREGMLLVDEIESGLHYSVQADMWRLIFATARRLNVQVFATTHSWDCIQGFQRAAAECEQEEGVLISLRERQGEISAVLFDEDELETITSQLIEVR